MDTNIKYNNLINLIENIENINKIQEIKESYLQLLENLSIIENIDNNLFIQRIKEINNIGNIYICYTEINNTIQIIGSGTIIFEPKILRGGKYVARIEDIVVKQEFRNLGIAKNIINHLILLSKNYSFPIYKIILVCNNNYINFYKKFGFIPKDNNLVLYF
jgi:glucosamine-phosphate N-acetyltransferase